MQNVLIALRDLKIGGIEKSAITLINYLSENGYNVTLVLEEKTGELLGQINDRTEIIEYKSSSMKNTIIRKAINGFKRLNFKIKYGNKFDAAISYATYSRPSSFVARVASENSILWCHADYLALFGKDTQKVKEFFEEIYYDEFSKIVFVSKCALRNFQQVFPEQKNTFYCNNLIDSKKIYEQTSENIDLKYNQETTTFLNVGRHDEKQKKLSRIIKAAYLLKREKYKFRIVFVGDGKDTQKYKKLAQKYNLQENIIFEGTKENPYPYFKIADCIVLSSDYEGYPVVFLESYVLNKPVITTDISDYEDISQGRGIVTLKSTKAIYKAMKNFLNNGYYIKDEFDVRKYNLEMVNNLKEILKNS